MPNGIYIIRLSELACLRGNPAGSSSEVFAVASPLCRANTERTPGQGGGIHLSMSRCADGQIMWQLSSHPGIANEINGAAKGLLTLWFGSRLRLRYRGLIL